MGDKWWPGSGSQGVHWIQGSPVPKRITGCWQNPRFGSFTWGWKSHRDGESQVGAGEPDPHPIQEWGKAQRLGCRGGDPVTAFTYFNSLASVKTRQIWAEEGDKLQITNPTKQ